MKYTLVLLQDGGFLFIRKVFLINKKTLREDATFTSYKTGGIYRVSEGRYELELC